MKYFIIFTNDFDQPCYIADIHMSFLDGLYPAWGPRCSAIVFPEPLANYIVSRFNMTSDIKSELIEV